jgi:putative AlgH/UPF0301 family transcriptional regulator
MSRGFRKTCLAWTSVAILLRKGFVLSFLFSLPRPPTWRDEYNVVHQCRDYYGRCSVALFSSSSSPSNWIHQVHDIDDLKVGDLVISRVESSLGCHDLRQPYLHKAVVLILDHEPEDFTQGVLLNRASDLILKDKDIVYQDDGVNKEDEPSSTSSVSSSWNVHFGGDIASWYEEDPQLLCLHTIRSEAALAVSDPVILENWDKVGIFVTSHWGARSLVESGHAEATDFFTFSGFCGWEEGQLRHEVDRGSWYLASLLNGLDRQQNSSASILWNLMECHSWKYAKYRPESAGISFWTDLVFSIGKKNEVGIYNSFSDLMLKEWATHQLLVVKGEVDEEGPPPLEIDDSDIFRAVKAASMADSIRPGALFRGSSEPSSPFLLKDQLFHKSIILLLQDDLDASVGVILNLPTTESHRLITNRHCFDIPIRYGGPSGRADQDQPLFWFHNIKALKNRGVGRCIQSQDPNSRITDSIFVCTEEDATQAIQGDLAAKDDFILVRGFSAWEKESGSHGILGEVQNGNLEVVPFEKIGHTFENLLAQKRLSEETFNKNFQIMQETWMLSGTHSGKASRSRDVFGSEMAVTTLADAALENWIRIFILGNAENYDYLP